MVRFSRIRSPKPRISILAVTVLALLSIGGAVASGAQASEWNIGAHTLVERGVSSEQLAGTGSGIQITSTVLAGEPFEANCSSVTTQGSISQGGAGTSAVSLSGCSVAKPAGCVFKEQPVLEGSVQLVEVGGTVYQKFVPPPEKTRFGLLKLINCAATGSYQLNGSFAGLSSQTEKLVEQPTSFSPAINSAAGAELKLGTKAATLTGTVVQHLSGPFTGRYFQVKGATAPFNWVVNGAGLYPGTTHSITASGGPFQFVTGSAGAPLKWSCGSVALREGRIVSGGGAEGALNFSGCKMVEPAGCAISSEFTTTRLSGTFRSIGGYDYETFTPKEGQVITGVKITNCPSLAGSYQVTGTSTVRGNQDGVSALSQPFEFSSAVDTIAGTSLKFGNYQLQITGSMNWTTFDFKKFGIN